MGLFLDNIKFKFKVGDTIKVSQRIIEGGKERLQMFQGIVIKIKGDKANKTFTVRKISQGIGVEKIWPADSPFIKKIEVVSSGLTRRSKLYYLRHRTGRGALKVKTKYFSLENKSEPIKKKLRSKTPKVTKKPTKVDK